MLTSQNPDPREKKPFLLWRPVAALWNWLVPPSVAHADRQPRLARFIAAGLVLAAAIASIVVVLLNGRAWHHSYNQWRSSLLARDAAKFEQLAIEYGEQNHRMEYQDTMVKAFNLAGEAYKKDPENPNAVRVAARIYTRAGASESRWLWNKLEKLDTLTDDDVAWRIQSLASLKEDKTASEQIEEVLKESKPSRKIVSVADQVMQNLGRTDQLLGILKTYSQEQPDDLDTRLLLGVRLHQFGNASQKAEGLSILWELAANDAAVGLRALDYLDGQKLSDADSRRLIDRLKHHPLAEESQRIAALKREAALDPSRKDKILQEAIEAHRHVKRDDMVPLARWLYEERAPEKLLDLLKEDQVRDHPPLLHDYLNALTMLKRYDDIERLVKDPRSALTTAERKFHLVHLAFVKGVLTEKPNDEVDKLLVDAVNAAVTEGKTGMLLELGRYAMERKHYQTALEAYKSASITGTTELAGYEGMLQASYLMGSMKDFLSISRETARRWPSNQYFVERYLYACLLSGLEMETTTARARKLLELREKDSQRKLIVALAEYRLGDRAACVRELNHTNLDELSPGQRAVFCGLARLADTAQAAALSKGIPEGTPMLPEEEHFFRMARSVAVNP